MKTLVIFSIVILLAMKGFTQEWAPVGAAWHYTEKFSFWSLNDEDYIKYESEKDTVFMGINCKKIVKRHDVYCYQRPENEFMYSNNNKVYFYDPSFNEFQMIYDFNASPDESWEIRIYDMLYSETDTVKITVDSSNSININSQNLKRLYVTYDFNNESIMPFVYQSVIIESIGDMTFMFNFFPENALACDDNVSAGLRCYEDGILGLYETGIADSCTYIHEWVGVDQTMKPNLDVVLFPNPASDVITIKPGTHDIDWFNLINSNGITVKSGKLTNHQIPVRELNRGLFILELSDSKSGVFERQKILLK